MTPKEKAKELVERFYSTYNAELLGLTHARKDAEGNAIIAAEEIIKELESRGIISKFWQSVLTELQNL